MSRFRPARYFSTKHYDLQYDETYKYNTFYSYKITSIDKVTRLFVVLYWSHILLIVLESNSLIWSSRLEISLEPLKFEAWTRVTRAVFAKLYLKHAPDFGFNHFEIFFGSCRESLDTTITWHDKWIDMFLQPETDDLAIPKNWCGWKCAHGINSVVNNWLHKCQFWSLRSKSTK